MTDLAVAVDRGDLDDLVRLVDGLTAAREWDRIVELRDRCRHALERGLQLWPAAEYAEYRLALDAPGSHAAPVVTDGAGRFALGPLWEVAASTHTWAELAPHLPPGPARSLVAHERVLRGEDLSEDDTIDASVLELPLRLQSWEPAYAVAVYRASQAEFPTPELPSLRVADAGHPAPEWDDVEGVEALIDLAAPWAAQSNGRVEARAVSGDGPGAIAALCASPVLVGHLGGSGALAWMAWTAASGGAYGRRRGGALGRFAAWWTVATLGGLDWPPPPDEIAAALHDLTWMRWEEAGTAHGWVGSLAVADPGHGVAWALHAVDDHRSATPIS